MILKKYLAFVCNPRYHRLYTLDKPGTWAKFALRDEKGTKHQVQNYSLFCSWYRLPKVLLIAFFLSNLENLHLLINYFVVNCMSSNKHHCTLNTDCIPACQGMARRQVWFIEHSTLVEENITDRVVNCFQIVSLIYWTQRLPLGTPIAISCELLSDCIFDLLNTATIQRLHKEILLWIAFRLYLWFIEHSNYLFTLRLFIVVNCFQIVSLIYWTQPGWSLTQSK